MPNESYFMTFGTLGLTLAGFAGLISALSPRAVAASPVAVYRVRTIVFLGLSLTFVGLGTVAVYNVIGQDLVTTVRVATLAMTVPFLRGLLLDTRPGPLWPNETARWVSIAILVGVLAVALVNLMVASLSVLQLLLLLGVVGPLSIFYNTIHDATDPAPAVDHEQEASRQGAGATPRTSASSRTNPSSSA